MKKLLVFLFGLLLLPTAWAANPQVELVTNHGRIVLELYPNQAPRTVENFLGYVEQGHYNGLIFHRVIKGFMIQGGGFDPGMVQRKTGTPIPNEADNGLQNRRGTVAMARTNDPHSATAQFFINTVDNASLDHRGKNARGWGYCVFGRVVEGMEAVDSIEALSTTMRAGHRDVPIDSAIIERAQVLEAAGG